MMATHPSNSNTRDYMKNTIAANQTMSCQFAFQQLNEGKRKKKSDAYCLTTLHTIANVPEFYQTASVKVDIGTSRTHGIASRGFIIQFP
jgi:hypothetical protein